MTRPQHIVTIRHDGLWIFAVDGVVHDSFRTRELAMGRALLWARTAVQQERRVEIRVPDGNRLKPVWRDGIAIDQEPLVSAAS